MTRYELDQLERIPLRYRCPNRNAKGNRCRREHHGSDGSGAGCIYFSLDGSASLNDERSDDS